MRAEVAREVRKEALKPGGREAGTVSVKFAEKGVVSEAERAETHFHQRRLRISGS